MRATHVPLCVGDLGVLLWCGAWMVDGILSIMGSHR